MLQELAAKSAELAEQEQFLQDRELAMQSQAQELEAKQSQLMQNKAEVSAQREGLSEARRQLEQQRRPVEQRFAVPSYWESATGRSGASGNDTFVPLEDEIMGQPATWSARNPKEKTLEALEAAILIDNLDWIGWGRDQACPAQRQGLQLISLA